MSKNVKKKKLKRRLNMPAVATLIFGVSFIAYLFSTLFLRSINNNLSTQIQGIDSQITVLQTQNDAVQVDIQQLSSSDRVNTIATDSGMSHNQENIIAIPDSITDGE